MKDATPPPNGQVAQMEEYMKTLGTHLAPLSDALGIMMECNEVSSLPDLEELFKPIKWVRLHSRYDRGHERTLKENANYPLRWPITHYIPVVWAYPVHSFGLQKSEYL